MKSRVAAVGLALVAAVLWVSASPLVSQSHETPSGPSLERFESHMERWSVSSEREVVLDLTDGSTLKARMCGTPAATAEFLTETRAVLSVVSDEMQGFEIQAATVAQIPLVFHVIQKPSGEGFLSDEQIGNQVQVLNQEYKSAGVQFYIQGVDDVVNKSWFKQCLPVKRNGKRNGKYFKMTKKLAVDPASTINIYTCRPFGNILGWKECLWDAWGKAMKLATPPMKRSRLLYANVGIAVRNLAGIRSGTAWTTPMTSAEGSSRRGRGEEC